MKSTALITQVKETIESVTPEERQQLIKQLEELLQEPEEVEVPTQCPRCENEHIVKKGRTKNGQRYLCKGCNRTFGHSTSKVLATSKLPLETWKKFAECFVDKVNIRRSAEKCGVNIRTAFFMRHRVLELVDKHVKKVTVHKESTAYVDETFFPINFKGSEVPKGYKPKKRANGKRRKGRNQSKVNVCVVMGVTNTGAVFHQVAGYSTLSKNNARLVLGDIVQAGSTVVTDKNPSYAVVLEELGANHQAYDSRKERGELAKINALHSKTKNFMRRFSSVATKNLSRYLSWMEWLDYSREQETLDVLHESTYTVHRSAMRSEDIPPMDGLTRRTVACFA